MFCFDLTLRAGLRPCKFRAAHSHWLCSFRPAGSGWFLIHKVVTLWLQSGNLVRQIPVFLVWALCFEDFLVTLPSDFPRRGSYETSGKLKPVHDLETQLSLFSHVGLYLAGTHVTSCCYLHFPKWNLLFGSSSPSGDPQIKAGERLTQKVGWWLLLDGVAGIKGEACDWKGHSGCLRDQ